jgi:hypothetical protein
LQVHAYPTRRAARTFSRQQLRQSACGAGVCTVADMTPISENPFRTSSPAHLGASIHRLRC